MKQNINEFLGKMINTNEGEKICDLSKNIIKDLEDKGIDMNNCVSALSVELGARSYSVGQEIEETIDIFKDLYSFFEKDTKNDY